MKRKALAGLLAIAILLLQISANLVSAEGSADYNVNINTAAVGTIPTLYGANLEDVNHELYGGIWSQMIFGESFSEEPRSTVKDEFAAIFTAVGGGDNWYSYAGEQGNEVRIEPVSANMGDCKLILNDSACTSGTISADIYMQGGISTGLAFRVTNPQPGIDNFNGYVVGLTQNQVSVEKHAYNYTPISSTPCTAALNTWVNLKVAFTGNTIAVYVNGSLITSYTDTAPLAAGDFALRAWDGVGRYRNIKIIKDSGAETAIDIPAAEDSVRDVSGMWGKNQSGTAVGQYSLFTDDTFHNNKQGQWIEFVSGAGTVGIDNEGLNRMGMGLSANKVYEGYIYARSDTPITAYMVLESHDGQTQYAETEIAVHGNKWKKYNFTMTPNAADDAARFSIKLKTTGSIELGHVFLEPGAWGRYNGLHVRKDVVDLMLEEGISILRFGGGMVNNVEYRWKNMIGAPENRSNYTGTWYEYSSFGFGIIDFMNLCEEMGIPAIPNLGCYDTPQDVSDFIDFVKGTDPNNAWVQRRIAMGHPNPYELPYLEIGNEEFIDATYADYFNQVADIVWAKTNDTILIAGDYLRSELIGDPNNVSGAVNLVGQKKMMDYAAAHNRPIWFDAHLMTPDITAAKQYVGAALSYYALLKNLSPGADIKLPILELNSLNHNMQVALANAFCMNVAERQSDLFPIVCAANALQVDGHNDNDWDQGLLFMNSNSVWLQPSGYAIQMAAKYDATYLLNVTGLDGNAKIDVSASKSEDGNTVVVKIVNPENEPYTVKIDIPGISNQANSLTILEMNGNLNDANTAGSPNNITPTETYIENAMEEDSMIYSLAPYSYTILKYDADGLNLDSLGVLSENSNPIRNDTPIAGEKIQTAGDGNSEALSGKKVVEDFTSYTADWAGVYVIDAGVAPGSANSLRFVNPNSGGDTVWSQQLLPANQDWTNANYYEFYIRNNKQAPVVFGFYLSEGDNSGLKELYYMKSGAQIYFDSKNGTITPYTLSGDIFIEIPGNFEGYVKLPLGASNYGNLGVKDSVWSWCIGDGILDISSIYCVTPQLAAGQNQDFNMDSLKISYDDDIAVSQFPRTGKKVVEDFTSYVTDWPDVYELDAGVAPGSANSLRFVNVSSTGDTVWSHQIAPANQDWTNANYFEFYIRNNKQTPVTFGFYLAEGDGTNLKELYYIKSGTQIYFDSKSGTIIPHTQFNDVYITIPADFEGYIKFPMNTSNYGNLGVKDPEWDWCIDDGMLDISSIYNITLQLAAGQDQDFNMDSLKISYDNDIAVSQFPTGKKVVEDFTSYTTDWPGVYELDAGVAPGSAKSLRFENQSSPGNTVWWQQLSSANQDWTGAKYYEIYVRNNKSTATSLQMFLADGDGTNVKELYNLKAGAQIYFDSKDGTVTSYTFTAYKYFRIPANFEGYIKFPLDASHYENNGWLSADGILNTNSIYNVIPQLVFGQNQDFNIDSITISYDDDIAASQFNQPPVDFGRYYVTADGPNVYLSNITPGTTVSEMTGEIGVRLDTEVIFKSAEGTTTLTAGDTVGTGTMIVVQTGASTDTYKIVIYGDVDGDGHVDQNDLASIQEYLLGGDDLGAINKLAGDIYGEGDITLNSLLAIMADVSGNEPLSQTRMTSQAVQFVGRFKNTGVNTYQFGWSGSTIEAGFIGTDISVNLRICTENTEDYVDVIIDNGTPRKLKISGTVDQYTLAVGLENGYHTVKIVKRTELSVGTLEYSGFVYGSGMAAVLPAGTNRKIEILGDAITAGYGNEGVAAGFRASEENAYLSYGMLAARQLNADSTILAYSGIGAYQDCYGGNAKLGDFYSKTLQSSSTNDWNFSKNIPDVVVINLGTSDFTSNVDPDDFKGAYTSLLNTIRTNYPNASLFCCMGPTTYSASASIAEVVAQCNTQGDQNIYAFDFAPIHFQAEGTGADGYASAATHARMANELANQIKEKLGW